MEKLFEVMVVLPSEQGAVDELALYLIENAMKIIYDLLPRSDMADMDADEAETKRSTVILHLQQAANLIQNGLPPAKVEAEQKE